MRRVPHPALSAAGVTDAPSIFTNRRYSRAHLEEVQSLTSSLNGTVQSAVERSRALRFDGVMWQSIYDYGSLTSGNSAEIGLVDAAPPADPFVALLELNAKEQKETLKGKKAAKENATSGSAEGENEKSSSSAGRKKFEQKFGLSESYTKFNATEAVSVVKYGQMLNMRERVERRRRNIDSFLHSLSEKSTATSSILSALGLNPEEGGAKRDKIAVVTVDGNIASSSAYEVIRSLRQIRRDEDVKSVVLRVNSGGGSVISSEAILEELKMLDRPVVSSMSNYCASGGYYISTSSEKVFAHPSTITGSIGVFGVKFDASEWAGTYGVRGDHWPRGSHAAAMHPLAPLTPRAKENISRVVLDYYDYFKAIVAAARGMSPREVEAVAQGRVWTGEQAKEVGLVDAMGGLERAVSYAKAAHTTTAKVDVEHWPKRNFGLKGLLGRDPSVVADAVQSFLAAVTGQEEVDKPETAVELLDALTELKFAEKLHFLLAMDEKTALDIIMRGE